MKYEDDSTYPYVHRELEKVSQCTHAGNRGTDLTQVDCIQSETVLFERPSDYKNTSTCTYISRVSRPRPN